MLASASARHPEVFQTDLQTFPTEPPQAQDRGQPQRNHLDSIRRSGIVSFDESTGALWP